MTIKLTKKCGWKKVYINVLDKNHQLLRKDELKFKEKVVLINLNLKKEK